MAEIYKCAFSGTLVGGQFGCRYAKEVTRRGGPDIGCTGSDAHLDCSRLFECFKAAALPTLGFEDDLLTMPHSAVQKIQFGGLIGLQIGLHPDSAEKATVDDIRGLVEEAAAHFGGIEGISCDAYVDKITAYKLKRRGAR